MAAFFNSAATTVNATVMLPLYYAGVAANGNVNVSRAEPSGALFKVPGSNTASSSAQGRSVSNSKRGGQEAEAAAQHHIGPSGLVRPTLLMTHPLFFFGNSRNTGGVHRPPYPISVLSVR